MLARIQWYEFECVQNSFLQQLNTHIFFEGVNCDDIDECASEPCFPGVACDNVIGSFFCDLCPEGMVGNGMFCAEGK